MTQWWLDYSKVVAVSFILRSLCSSYVVTTNYNEHNLLGKMMAKCAPEKQRERERECEEEREREERKKKRTVERRMRAREKERERERERERGWRRVNEIRRHRVSLPNGKNQAGTPTHTGCASLSLILGAKRRAQQHRTRGACK
jgi:hypothetical protein